MSSFAFHFTEMRICHKTLSDLHLQMNSRKLFNICYVTYDLTGKGRTNMEAQNQNPVARAIYLVVVKFGIVLSGTHIANKVLIA